MTQDQPAPSATVTEFPAAAPTTTDKAPRRDKLWHNVAVRLADEGVPVRAISRALMLPGEEIREVLKGASERGMIIAIPRDDWPPGTRRDERVPDTVPLEYEDEHMTMLAMRTFKLTPAMARMFIALLRRPEMTKASLHLCTQRSGEGVHDDQTDIKIVDVFVCKLRKKLPDTIKIITLWGRGYAISAEHKSEAFKLLGIKHEEFAPIVTKLDEAA